MSKGDDIRLYVRTTRPSRAATPRQGGNGTYGDRAAWDQEHAQRIKKLTEDVAQKQAELEAAQRRATECRHIAHTGGRLWTAEEIEILRAQAALLGPVSRSQVGRVVGRMLGRSPKSVVLAMTVHGIALERPGG